MKEVRRGKAEKIERTIGRLCTNSGNRSKLLISDLKLDVLESVSDNVPKDKSSDEHHEESPFLADWNYQSRQCNE